MNSNKRLTTLYIILTTALSLGCGSVDKIAPVIYAPSASPIPGVKIPADFKEFEIGPFRLLGPADFKKVNVKGIDSEVHGYENREFSLGMDISSMFYNEKYELEERSYEHYFGTMVIDGRIVKYKKGDLKKSLPTAARNADGSKSPPAEKNHFITVFIPEAHAVVSVSYGKESSTESAFAILQSLKVIRSK